MAGVTQVFLQMNCGVTICSSVHSLCKLLLLKAYQVFNCLYISSPLLSSLACHTTSMQISCPSLDQSLHSVCRLRCQTWSPSNLSSYDFRLVRDRPEFRTSLRAAISYEYLFGRFGARPCTNWNFLSRSGLLLYSGHNLPSKGLLLPMCGLCFAGGALLKGLPRPYPYIWSRVCVQIDVGKALHHQPVSACRNAFSSPEAARPTSPASFFASPTPYLKAS